MAKNNEVEELEVVKKSKTMDIFMKGKAKDLESEFVIVSKRFLDSESRPVPFELRAITTERIEELQDECTQPVFKKGRKIDERLDYKRFGAKMGIETTVYPNFRDKDLLDSYGIVDPVELVKEVLSVGGEYAEWIEAVQRVNGFDENFQDLVEEAKN